MSRLAAPPSDMKNCKLALAGLRQCNFSCRYARQTAHFANAPKRTHFLSLVAGWRKKGTAAAEQRLGVGRWGRKK